MKRSLIWIAALVSLGAALYLAGTALAQQPTPSDDQVNAVARQLYCPVCENIPLDVCPTPACAQWRGTIRDLLAQGKTTQDIKDYFVLHYGDRVLAEPPRRGLNWIVYVLPPLLILAGAGLVIAVLRRMRAASPGQPAVPTPPAAAGQRDEYLERLEEELRRRESS